LVEIYPKSRKLAPLMESLRGVGRRAPEWLQFDASTLSGKVLAAPKRDQIDSPVEEQLIVEFYSR
jgi:small subunit ribosomal protein S4